MALLITDSNFKEILAANAVVLVDFGAAWCGPCRSMAPVIDELATAYEGKAAVGKVDIEESPEITEEYGIRSVPTIIFFKNGELVPGKKIVGATQKPKLTAILDELI